MSARVAVAVIGARGRMGRFACELLSASSSFALTASYDRDDDWAKRIGESGARLALDFTVAGLGFEHGLRLIERGVGPVIGTSGVTLEENLELDRAARARNLGGLVVPNFSLGSALLQRFARDAARHFESVEIIELHHPRKADAPSGTALETARRIAEARGIEFARSASPSPARGETAGGVTIHSVRLNGLYAHQEVLLGAPGELLSLRHDMSSPDAFGPGILAALAFAAQHVGVARGLEAALEREPGRNP